MRHEALRAHEPKKSAQKWVVKMLSKKKCVQLVFFSWERSKPKNLCFYHMPIDGWMSIKQEDISWPLSQRSEGGGQLRKRYFLFTGELASMRKRAIFHIFGGPFLRNSLDQQIASSTLAAGKRRKFKSHERNFRFWAFLIITHPSLATCWSRPAWRTATRSPSRASSTAATPSPRTPTGPGSACCHPRRTRTDETLKNRVKIR